LPSDQFQERLLTKWFMKHHVIAQVRVHGEILLIFLVASHGDNLRSEAYEVELPNQLPTIHLWDLEIDEHEVDAYHTEETEAFLPIGGCKDRITLRLQNLLKRAPYFWIVFDHKESLHAIPLFTV
jgi:hypothetical protein